MSNIVFMGTPQFAVPILKKINQKYKINCVFTQPPSKSNRGQKFTKSSIHICAEELNLEVKTPKKIDEEFEYLKELNLDLVVVVAYGQIISKKILDLSKKGFLNIHASLLPKWRGAAPIQRSILNNEKKTGISFMKIDEKLDSGPVCNKYSIDILDQDNAEILSEKLSYLSTEKILENVQKVLDGEAIFKEQDHAKATYAKKIQKIEGKIDWNNSARKIIAQINGLYPKPGAWFELNNKRHKILKAKINKQSAKIGEVIDEQMTIACGENSINIIEIQKEGKNPQLINEFLLGNKVRKGTIITSE